MPKIDTEELKEIRLYSTGSFEVIQTIAQIQPVEKEKIQEVLELNQRTTNNKKEINNIIDRLIEDNVLKKTHRGIEVDSRFTSGLV